MNQSQLEQLIDRYLQGSATEEEVNMVERFYSHIIEGKEENEGMNAQDKMQIRNRIYRNIQAKISTSKSNNIRYFLTRAAAVLILLVSGYLPLSVYH